VCVLAANADEAARAIRGLRSVAFLDLAGYVLGGGAERSPWVAMGELDGLLAAGAEGLPTDRPIVTVCESGARAAIAASILVAHGYDARPVLDGGVATWRERGGATVSFRRCG